MSTDTLVVYSSSSSSVGLNIFKFRKKVHRKGLGAAAKVRHYPLLSSSVVVVLPEGKGDG